MNRNQRRANERQRRRPGGSAGGRNIPAPHPAPSGAELFRELEADIRHFKRVWEELNALDDRATGSGNDMLARSMLSEARRDDLLREFQMRAWEQPAGSSSVGGAEGGGGSGSSGGGEGGEGGAAAAAAGGTTATTTTTTTTTSRKVEDPAYVAEDRMLAERAAGLAWAAQFEERRAARAKAFYAVCEQVLYDLDAEMQTMLALTGHATTEGGVTGTVPHAGTG